MSTLYIRNRSSSGSIKVDMNYMFENTFLLTVGDVVLVLVLTISITEGL